MGLRTRRGLALLASVMFVAAACGTGATGTPTGGATGTPAGSPSSAPPSASAIDLTKTSYAPSTATTTGGSVVMAEWQSPDSINTYYGSAFTNNEAFYANAFDGLVRNTFDLGYFPDLVTEVPTTTNGDVVVNGTKMDVTFKMKDGMKWSDGQPLNCDDVIGTWKWIMDKDNSGLTAGITGWEDITSIDGAGSTTCVVHFGKIYEGYLTLIDPVLPQHYITTIPVKDAVSKLYPLADPSKGVYSGPYIPTSYVTDQAITFKANPNFQTIGLTAGTGKAHAPYLDKVTMQLFGTAEAMTKAFTAGSIDVAMDLNDADLPSLSSIPDCPAIGQPTGTTPCKVVHDSLTYEHHDYNNKSLKAKFGDDYTTIIKALRLATDREAIAAGPLQGNVSVTNNFISPLTWYYKDEGGSTKADPAAASKLLTDAGWVKGSDGFLAKGGKTLSVDYCTTTRQVRVDTLNLVASQLKAIGVKAVVTAAKANPNVFGAYNSTPADTKCNLLHGNFDVAEFAYISPLDPQSGYFVYVSTQAPDNPPHNGQNDTRIALPELDAAYTAVKDNVDPAKIQAAMYTVQDIYASDKNTFELPLYLRKDVWLVNPKLQNFTGHPSIASSEWNIADWWLQQ